MGENKHSVHVAVTGNCHYKTESIMQILMKIRNRSEINLEVFRRLICEAVDKEELNADELLVAFIRLDDEQQDKIIEQSTFPLEQGAQSSLKLPLVDELINYGRENNIDYIESYNEKLRNMETEINLRKRIKYCKNPMEKQRLQREFSTMNFANGKHHRGRKG